jgi:hypothetical protein
VAEKILTANEKSLDELKSQKRALDSRVTKLQNMKKVQQQILQKVLATPPASTIVAASTTAPTTSKTANVSNIQKSKSDTAQNLPVNPPPPPPPDLLQPPLPPSPPPQPPPPPPEPKSPEKTQIQPSTSSTREESISPEMNDKPISSNLIKRNTLAEEMNLTILNSKKSATVTNSVTASPTSTQKLASTRPNLLVSKQTDQKLEEIAKQGNQQTVEKNASLVINAKVVNVVKSVKNNAVLKSPTKQIKNTQPTTSTDSSQNLKVETKKPDEGDKSSKADLFNRQKLTQYLKNVTVSIFNSSFFLTRV